MQYIQVSLYLSHTPPTSLHASKGSLLPPVCGRLENTIKRLTPYLSNALLAKPKIRHSIARLETYLGIIQGKGAASAWSRQGEALAIARTITAPHPVVFDVGARIGEWTTLTAKHLARPATFILIEPSSVHWPILKYLNVPGTCHLVDAAAGKARGTAVLRGTFPGSGNASLWERRDSYWDEPFDATEEVRVTTVSAIADQCSIDAIDFMKVDVEGGELDVLKGAAPLLEAGRIRALSFEFGSANVTTRVFFRDFWDLLTGYGFHLARITPGSRLVPIERYDERLEHFRGATNYLGIRAP